MKAAGSTQGSVKTLRFAEGEREGEWVISTSVGFGEFVWRAGDLHQSEG
jgi:hypothetical protein